MKKLILTTLLFTVFSNVAFAQLNYTDGQQIYIDNTLTFKCEYSLFGILLSNIHDFDLTSRNQSVPSFIDDETWMGINRANSRFKSNGNAAMLNAFYETFTQSELDALSGSHLRAHLIWDKQGNIVNVTLGMNQNDPKLRAVSPQKYATFYKKFKSYVKFDIQDTRANYNDMMIDIRIDRVRSRQLLFNPDSYAN